MLKIINKPYIFFFIGFGKLFSRKNLKKFITKSVNRYYKKGLFVLNIGAGGEFEQILKKKGVDLKSIDIDKKRKPDFHLSIENLSQIKSNSIDIIFCLEVLEHVKNPQKGILEIKRVLKKDGIIIGSTPFLHPIHDEPYDFYRYTRYGLRHIFNSFKEIHLKERNSYIENIVVIILRLFYTNNLKKRAILIILFPFLILICLLLLPLCFIIDNNNATTGYTFIYKK